MGGRAGQRVRRPRLQLCRPAFGRGCSTLAYGPTHLSSTPTADVRAYPNVPGVGHRHEICRQVGPHRQGRELGGPSAVTGVAIAARHKIQREWVLGVGWVFSFDNLVEVRVLVQTNHCGEGPCPVPHPARFEPKGVCAPRQHSNGLGCQQARVVVHLRLRPEPAWLHSLRRRAFAPGSLDAM